MRRNLLVILLGLLFLALLTWLGGLVANLPAASSESGQQQVRAGPYEVTLQLNPDPPLSTQPATIVLRIAEAASGTLIKDAHVQVESTMPEMDMGLPTVSALPSSDGLYRARVQFVMAGLWQLHVTIQRAAHPDTSLLFQVTAH
ncbi:MAG: FixH family protein [Thermogemmatispora sp.]|uniref:FixH family protein n=1 Tax=Thermogemmatispora sp. TaxID=1968838 RepID=UPI002619B130|nr:FixH family protein [Thermogemmatispora sp.]MBX5456887.1 FixH family protein [Thermogemmatispora sp.]